jgi:hypothetical protein
MTWKHIDTQEQLNKLTGAFCWADASVLEYHATWFIPPGLPTERRQSGYDHLNVYVLLDGGTSDTRFVELALLRCDKVDANAFLMLHLSGRVDERGGVTIDALDGATLLHCARLAHRRVILQGRPQHYFASGSWLEPTPAEPVWGLSALGISGPVRLDLHEALPPANELWSLDFQIDGIGGAFPLPSPDGITKLRDFLQQNLGQTDSRPAQLDEFMEVRAGTAPYSTTNELVIRSPRDTTLRVAKDEELPDRFIVTICGADSRVAFDVCGALVNELVTALDKLITNLSA